MLLRILLCAQPATVRRTLTRAFEAEGAVVTTAQSERDLWERLTRDEQDMVVLGRGVLPEPPEALIESIRRLPGGPDVVVVRPEENPEERARLLAAGALAALWERLPEPALVDAIRALTARHRTDAINRFRAERPQERFSLNDFIYQSLPMQQFMAVARRVATSDSTVLIQGETGVGKERLARALHHEGPRTRGPFIAINCGAFPEGMLESELFGHEQGAFTGASRARRGYFELAHRGTIFLDEVGDIPMHLQTRLLRVLEERTLRRLGGERETPIDVRVVAATNRDLEAETKARGFRLDLYYRLAVVTLTIPPLRDRRQDIPLLTQSYIDHFRAVLHAPVVGVTDAAMDALCGYQWPGNVRELINVIERSMLLSSGDRLDLADLPPAIAGGAALQHPPTARERSSLFERPLLDARQEVVREFEQEYLTVLLERSQGRVGDAAARAGVNVRSIHEMMKRHGIRKEAFKR